MKLMIASDIHGAAGFCRALLAACAAEAPDRLLLLGDILYHGPRNDLPEGYDPKQVIALLNPLRDQLLCVRGNCDTEVDQMVLNFPILSDSCAVWEAMLMSNFTGELAWPRSEVRFTPATRWSTSKLTRVAYVSGRSCR